MRTNDRLKRNRVWCFLIVMAALCVWMIPGTVYAGEKGSIELQLPGQAAGVEMTLYTIAEFQNGNYIYKPDFADSGLVIDDLNDAAQAQAAANQLASYAAERGMQGNTGTVDAQGILRFTGLEPALYLAAQTDGESRMEVQAAIVPIPYASASGEGWIYNAVISPKYSFPGGAVIASKVDENGNAVGQARFVLQKKVYTNGTEEIPSGAETGSDEGGTYYWKEFQANLVSSENGQIVITDMPLGTYRFVEVQAPEGFILSTVPSLFTIEGAGSVEETGGVYRIEAGQVAELRIVNRQTSVLINKVDSQGNGVAGAKLVLKDADRNVILDENGNAKYAFTTTTEPTELKQLPPGDYYVCEVEAPDGYHVAEDVKVTISDAPDAVNTVTMVDEREETTNARIHVTKHLVDIDERAVAAEDGTFYVALFSDEARTHRVSDVRPLHYVGSSCETVTFENLELNTSYYVGETTAYGDLLEGGSGDGMNYTPIYPDGYTVRLTPQKQESELNFNNVFFELPRDYYYEGSLTITKKVLRGGAAYDCDEVFYAGIFSDARYTERYGDVIALEMNGASEISVTVPVYIGQTIDSSITYYVTETDADGNPLAGAADLEFEVHVDHTRVTLTPDQTGGSVTITNTYREETETEVETETTPPSGGNGNPPTTVRTGDETPLLRYGLLMAAAGMLAAVLLVGRHRSKKKQRED